jgi:hypothetical protein
MAFTAVSYTFGRGRRKFSNWQLAVLVWAETTMDAARKRAAAKA